MGTAIEWLVDFARIPLVAASGGTLLFVAVALGARGIYNRYYLSHRLFFEPWVNLSKSEDLDIGSSLAELLYFELETLRELLQRARGTTRLWNERLSLPRIDRLFEGYPDFVRHVELLGLTGRLAAALRFVLAVRPRRFHGSIHQFGTNIRIQVMLEGQSPRRTVGGATRTQRSTAGPSSDSREADRIAWSRDLGKKGVEGLPAAIRSIAHEIALDLSGLHSFKSPESFVHFTDGLRDHLDFIARNGRRELAEAAQQHYQLSITSEPRNPYASYAMAQILYSYYDKEANDQAIAMYKDALQSDDKAVRARAFRGLADAYSQKCHRFKDVRFDVLENARRWAEFSRELCGESDQAAVLKAHAFATQIQADIDGLAREEVEAHIAAAMELYGKAISADPSFAVAHNNLGFLYLERAKRHIAEAKYVSGNEVLAVVPSSDERTEMGRRQSDPVHIVTPSDTNLTAAQEDLVTATSHCGNAVKSDPTYHHVYDNLGNIWFERSRLPFDDYADCLEQAETNYLKSTAYNKTYDAGYADLSRLYLRLASGMFPIGAGPAPAATEIRQARYVSSAWQAHLDCLTCADSDDGKTRRCADFRRWHEHAAAAPSFAPIVDRPIEGMVSAGCTCAPPVVRPGG